MAWVMARPMGREGVQSEPVQARGDGMIGSPPAWAWIEANRSAASQARRSDMSAPLEMPDAWTRAGSTHDAAAMSATTLRMKATSGESLAQSQLGTYGKRARPTGYATMKLCVSA